MICKNCGKEFKPKTKRARFCSTSCRVLYSRKTEEDGLTEEEREYIGLGLLNAQALLNAPPTLRQNWVEGARAYKPPYIDQFNYLGRKGVYGKRAKEV